MKEAKARYNTNTTGGKGDKKTTINRVQKTMVSPHHPLLAKNSMEIPQ